MDFLKLVSVRRLVEHKRVILLFNDVKSIKFCFVNTVLHLLFYWILWLQLFKYIITFSVHKFVLNLQKNIQEYSAFQFF